MAFHPEPTPEMALEDKLGNALGLALGALQTNRWDNRDIVRIETAFKAWCDKVVDAEAPAALAEPHLGWPSDKELLELMPQSTRDDLRHAAIACSEASGGRIKPGIFRVTLNAAALEYARAILAHFGCSHSNEP